MLHILLLMLLIGGTSQTSEKGLEDHRERTVSTTSRDSGYPTSPTKYSPTGLPGVDKEYFEVRVKLIIRGPLSALKQYFKTKPENGVLTLVYKTEPGPNTFKAQISSIDEKCLEGVTTVIIGLGILSPHHQEDIFGQLQQRNIKIITRC
jgi:hypothetical protein